MSSAAPVTAVSGTAGAALNGLQEYLSICRPKDYLAFAIKYMQDEKSSNPHMSHSLHSLIFLVDSPDEFLSAACTIYCNKLGEYYNNSGESSLKSFLDGHAVAELVRGLELGSIWFDVSAIDEIVYDRMAVLKRVDFNIFVSLLRFPIACYQLQWWLRDELTAFENTLKRSSPSKSSSNSTGGSSSGSSGSSYSNRELLQSLSSKLSADSTIDLLHLKQFIQRSKPLLGSIINNSTSSNRKKKSCSSSIHFQGSWGDADARAWTKVLLQTIDNFLDRSTSATTVGVLCNEFVAKFISVVI